MNPVARDAAASHAAGAPICETCAFPCGTVDLLLYVHQVEYMCGVRAAHGSSGSVGGRRNENPVIRLATAHTIAASGLAGCKHPFEICASCITMLQSALVRLCACGRRCRSRRVDGTLNIPASQPASQPASLSPDLLARPPTSRACAGSLLADILSSTPSHKPQGQSHHSCSISLLAKRSMCWTRTGNAKRKEKREKRNKTKRQEEKKAILEMGQYRNVT